MSVPKMSQTKAKQKKAWATLPLSRVSTIMKSSPEVTSVSPDAVILTAKAAELFLVHLARTALLKKGQDKESLDYNDIANVVYSESESQMGFLQDIIPKKIKAKEYLEILKDVEKKERILGRTIGHNTEIAENEGQEADNEEEEEDD